MRIAAAQAPRIVYVAREKPEKGRAPVLQIFHTLRGLCLAGAAVRVVTPWPARLFRRMFRDLLDRELPTELEMVSLGAGPSLPGVQHFWPSIVNDAFEARLARYLSRLAVTEPDCVVYTRNRRWVANLADGVYPPIVLEYHEPRSRVLADERGESDPQVARVAAEERVAASRVDLLVTVSRLHAEDAPALYGYNGPIEVIPNGADPDLLALAPGERRPIPGRFLYVGSLIPWKGLGIAIDALSHVPGAMLHICGGQSGTKPWEDLTLACRKHGVQDRVVRYGTVPQHALRPMLATSIAGILPLDARFSLAERYTSPLKVFEYLCAGLPVVAGDLPSVRDLVVHQREGLLFRPGDAQELARTMQMLIDSPDLVERLAAQARLAGESCTWQHRAERILQVCEQVLRTRRAAQPVHLPIRKVA